VLALLSIGAMTLTPRAGQENMLLPSALLIGSAFLAVHIFYLRMVKRTVCGNDR